MKGQCTVGNEINKKRTFWEGGMRTCPECKMSNLSCSKHCDGVRHNGDGYGTEVYKCKDCNWETSFQYDDAGKILTPSYL